MLIYGVAGAFYVQCLSISPMHGMAFLDSSGQRVRDRIVGALHRVFLSSACSALSHFHHLAPIELSRNERFTLAGYYRNLVLLRVFAPDATHRSYMYMQ